MARTVVRPRRKQRSSSGSSSRRPLLGNALREHRLPLAGVGLVLLAAALVNWVTGQISILDGLRESFVGAAGIGVFGRFLIERYKDGQLYRGSVEWRERAAAESHRTEEGRE